MRNSENSLIDAIRQGETRSFEPLAKLYAPLVEGSARAAQETYSVSYDEAHAEALLALYEAACHYDTNQDEVTFGLYAKVCIRHRFISVFARRKNTAHLSLDELYSNGTLEGMTSMQTQGDPVQDEEMLRHLHQKIRGTLSRYELDVFYLWLENYSTKEIAQKLGKGEKSVANAISRSLGKLRVALQ